MENIIKEGKFIAILSCLCHETNTKKMRKIYFVFILSSGKCQIVFRFNMDIRVDKFVLMCDFDCSVNLMWQLSHIHTQINESVNLSVIFMASANL